MDSQVETPSAILFDGAKSRLYAQRKYRSKNVITRSLESSDLHAADRDRRALLSVLSAS